MVPYNIISPFQNLVSVPSYFLLTILLLFSSCIQFHSNFNVSKVSNSSTLDPVTLPIILTPSPSHRHRHPTQQTTQFQYKQQQKQGYNFRRYQYKDTAYNQNQHSLNHFEQQILLSIQPPTWVFDVARTITIEDYQLLQVKEIRIMLINPTDRFKFCINEIYADSDSIQRTQQKKLPFCLNPNNKFPFYFNLYISEHKPIIFRSSIYFIVSVYDGQELVDQKIWPRQIIAKTTTNHLKIYPLQAKNCGTKNYTSLLLTNTHPHHYFKVSLENQLQTYEKGPVKNIIIPSQKNLKINLTSKQTVVIIATKVIQTSSPQIKYPKLYLPIYCMKYLQIHNFNFGILNSDRSIMELTISVTSYAKQLIEIKSIDVFSSSETIQIKTNRNKQDKIQPGEYTGVCQLVLHIPKQINKKTVIDIKILYVVGTNYKQVFQAKNTYKYYQFHNPLYLGSRRFIDVTKPEQNLRDPTKSHMFPIRNNLNLPLILLRVIFDQKIFKLTWLKDRRQYIFPNQQRDQFLFQYIGPKQLKLSPTKYIVILEFNGNLHIPIQVIIYDHTLQCVFNDQQQKCTKNNLIDYGYFRNYTTKSKQLIIRNWNPQPKQIKFKYLPNMIQNYGINYTMTIIAILPSHQLLSKKCNQSLFFYVKANHFIKLNIQLIPLPNATSGQVNFSFSTQYQQIFTKIRFKVENGTIGLIPYSQRINSAYEYTVQHLKLVSTFSQPYKIKNVFVNNSNIRIYFNNQSQIYEKQWIDIDIVYQPFQHVNYNPSTHSLHLTSVSTQTSSSQVINMTQQCCGNQFVSNYFITPLQNQFQRFTNVSIRVVTTTDLQANSTIIIDNTPPKLIKQQNFTISLINYNKNWQSSISNFNTYKIHKQCSYQHKQIKNNKNYIIKIKNIFKQYVKYKPIIIPRQLYQDTKEYISASKKTYKVFEDAMLCVSNVIAIKHDFSPQMVKTIFGLDFVPQQIIISPSDRQSQEMGSQKRATYDPSLKLSKYARRAIDEGASICYKMNTTRYIKQLIQSYILNHISQIFSNEIFQLFIQKQMQFYNSPLHYLSYDQFYDSLQSNFQHYCKKSTYPYFRFCKQIGIDSLPNTQMILQPAAESQLIINAVAQFRETSHEFYLVLLNNITKYQVHFIKINITQPKLKISKLYLTTGGNNSYKGKYSSNVLQGKDKIIEINKVQNFVKKHLTKKDLSKLTKIKQNQLQENDPSIKKYLLSSLIILLEESDKINQHYQLVRNFTLKNIGSVDIHITHIGFERYEKLCNYEGIYINESLCHGFVLFVGKQKNLSIKIHMPIVDFPGFRHIQLYMYNDDAFYFKLTIILKTLNQPSWPSSIYFFTMSISSFLFLVLVILAFKKQLDEKQKYKKLNIKTKIMNPINYTLLGTITEKKNKKILPIPQQQILAVKQIQQSKLKQFFNSSGQSQISKKQQTQEEQPSKIQIFNVFRNDRNSMSASEQSSFDFIDLMTINKSTQNVEQQSISKDQQDPSAEQEQSQSSMKDLSDADSNFNDGNQIDSSTVKQCYGWGDHNQVRKPVNQGSSSSYYNVFFSGNPLRKHEKQQSFHWMNQHHNQ